MKFVMFMWLVALGLVTWGHIRNEGASAPPPSGYVGAAMTYSLLLALAAVPGAGGLASVFAAGWTFSLYLRINNVPVAARPVTTAKAAG